MKSSSILASVLATASLAACSQFLPVKPMSLPLAVRSPYMNTWLRVGNGADGLLAGTWATFWGNQHTSWTGIITVDGTAYAWMGAPQVTNMVDQISAEFTSTRTTFLMDVGGKVQMNISFVSPVNPDDLVRQSIVGSYLNVDVYAADGGNHSVQLYTDITAEFVNPTSNGDYVQWNFTQVNGTAVHDVFRNPQDEFNFVNLGDDGSHWGDWLYTTAAVDGMTFQSGGYDTVRAYYLSNSKLPNTQDTNYRAINDDYPVFAFANDLGTIGNTATPAVSTLYTLVHAQENIVYFNQGSQNISIPGLWTSYFDSFLAMNSYFFADWATQDGKWDQIIASDSIAAAGTDYLTITSLSVRQAFGAIGLGGTPAKIYAFLKEISSSGDIQTVDVVFPATPIFIYSNVEWIKYLLQPLFDYQESGKFPSTWAVHDLGPHYPQAPGYPDPNHGAEYMPLEECGNMLIMTLVYAQRSGDTGYLTEHYPILKQWTNYLVEEALIPANQVSTDDFQGGLANQTNLALKGIIGIQAMSVVANLTGNSADAANYSSIAKNYLTQWEGFAIASSAKIPHTELNYGATSSSSLLYNLWGDKVLNLGLVPQSIYDMQSEFYPTIAEEYGIPLDTRNNNTKSDWQMFCASLASDHTKALFISKLNSYIVGTTSGDAFPDLYRVDNAQTGFAARPVVGGHFAILSLTAGANVANTTTTKLRRAPRLGLDQA